MKRNGEPRSGHILHLPAVIESALHRRCSDWMVSWSDRLATSRFETITANSGTVCNCTGERKQRF